MVNYCYCNSFYSLRFFSSLFYGFFFFTLSQPMVESFAVVNYCVWANPPTTTIHRDNICWVDNLCIVYTLYIAKQRFGIVIHPKMMEVWIAYDKFSFHFIFSSFLFCNLNVNEMCHLADAQMGAKRKTKIRNVLLDFIK